MLRDLGACSVLHTTNITTHHHNYQYHHPPPLPPQLPPPLPSQQCSPPPSLQEKLTFAPILHYLHHLCRRERLLLFLGIFLVWKFQMIRECQIMSWFFAPFPTSSNTIFGKQDYSLLTFLSQRNSSPIEKSQKTDLQNKDNLFRYIFSLFWCF